MKNFLYRFAILFLYFMVTSSISSGDCLIPSQVRIGGTLTVDGVQITADTDSGYVIYVTKEDGSDFTDVEIDPTDDDGLSSTNKYIIDIPIYSDSTCNPGGAVDNETVVIHVTYNGTEYKVSSPVDGEITVDADVSITEYNLIAYSPKTLTLLDPDHGSITANPSSGDNTYTHGTTVTLTADADIYYVFESWTGDLTGSVSPTTITMDGDKTVGATFTQCFYTLTTAVNDVQMGSVTPVTGDRACDSDVTITAIPEDGYYFTGWTGDVANPNLETTTVTMDGDKTVTANFTAITYTLSVQSPSNGTISLNPTSTGNVYGENAVVTVTATATPNSHYVFSGWTGDLTGSVSPTTITMDEDKTIGATFFICEKTLTMTVNDPQMGSTNPAAGANIQSCDEVVTITATAESGYHFVNWTGDVANTNLATTTVTMDTDQTVTANFIATSYTLTMGTASNGSTTPAAGTHEYGEGAVVTITATPSSGYVFSSWTGSVASSSSATTTVTMNSNKTVTANFVAASSGGDGDGGGGGGGGIFGEISIRDVLGYHFDGKRRDGTGVYMPVTSAYKALKGAQTHVEGFAPNIASLIRSGFDSLEKKAERNKDGALYRIGTYTFPVLGKIAEYYLDIVGAEKLKADAYSKTTISIDEFKSLEQQGKAVAPHRVNFEDNPEEGSAHK